MNELSKSSKISPYVKAVIYDGSVLSFDLSRNEWEGCLRWPDTCQLPAKPRKPTGRITPETEHAYMTAMERWTESCGAKNVYTPKQLEV